MLFKSYGWQLVDKGLHVANKHYAAEGAFSQIAMGSNMQDPIINEVSCACKNGLTAIYEAHVFGSKRGNE